MDLQQDPPYPSGPLPKFLWDFFGDLFDWLRGNRIVAGNGVSVTDAPGGGRLVSLNVNGLGIRDLPLIYSFEPLASPYFGGGTPPSNQGLKIIVAEGWLNTTQPGNINAEFVLTNNTKNYLLLEATFDTDASLLSCLLKVDTSVPDDPEGIGGAPPLKSTRPLCSITTASDQITKVVAFRRGSLDVVAQVTQVDCDTNTLQYFWGEQVADPRVLSE